MHVEGIVRGNIFTFFEVEAPLAPQYRKFHVKLPVHGEFKAETGPVREMLEEIR
jgi:hypothetical protein